MDYDFSGLTRAQQWILTFQGYTDGDTLLPKPQKRTLQPLIDRGLLVKRDLPYGGSVYEVPIPVHMAWCELCSCRR